MKLYEKNSVRIEYEPSQELISYLYLPSETLLTEAEFKANMEAYAGFCERYKPTKLLVDTRHMNFVIVPALQEWVAQVIAPRTLSLKKMAFVMAQDFFAQISVEQMLEEDEIAENYDKPQYFPDPESAKEWLLA